MSSLSSAEAKFQGHQISRGTIEESTGTALTMLNHSLLAGIQVAHQNVSVLVSMLAPAVGELLNHTIAHELRETASYGSPRSCNDGRRMVIGGPFWD